jgi:hypothetical protein
MITSKWLGLINNSESLIKSYFWSDVALSREMKQVAESVPKMLFKFHCAESSNFLLLANK